MLDTIKTLGRGLWRLLLLPLSAYLLILLVEYTPVTVVHVNVTLFTMLALALAYYIGSEN